MSIHMYIYIYTHKTHKTHTCVCMYIFLCVCLIMLTPRAIDYLTYNLVPNMRNPSLCGSSGQSWRLCKQYKLLL